MGPAIKWYLTCNMIVVRRDNGWWQVGKIIKPNYCYGEVVTDAEVLFSEVKFSVDEIVAIDKEKGWGKVTL